MKPRTMLQKDVEYLLKCAGIKPAVIDLTLMLVEIGEEDLVSEEDTKAISTACAQFERERSLPACHHGFDDRSKCPTCTYFDALEARERYARQSEQATRSGGS